MAKRKTARATLWRKQDLASWNFVIFLTLAFILIVVVLAAIRPVAFDLRSRAGLGCKTPELPSPEACPGGKWVYQRGSADGCPSFFCSPITTPENSIKY